MSNRFAFEPEKALEAILYIARRLRHPTLHTISKVLYFADQKHLRDYGRLICGDNYVAMKHGPVPSGVYDILKAVRGDGARYAGLESAVLARALAVDRGHHVTPLRDPDTAALSESDRGAMDWAIQEYGHLSFRELAERSHDPAWSSADENDIIELAAIVNQQPNAAELREHLELEADA